MNLPSGEISCPERLFRLSDSESVGVCLVCVCAGRESPRNASTETATASFFKRAPPADVQLYQTNGDGGWSDRDPKSTLWPVKESPRKMRWCGPVCQFAPTTSY